MCVRVCIMTVHVCVSVFACLCECACSCVKQSIRVHACACVCGVYLILFIGFQKHMKNLSCVICHHPSPGICLLSCIYIYIHIYVCTTNQMSPADIDKILHVNIRNCGFHLRSVNCFQLNISRRLSFSIYSFPLLATTGAASIAQ